MKGKERNIKDLWKRDAPAILGTITGQKQLDDLKAMREASRLYREEK